MNNYENHQQNRRLQELEDQINSQPSFTPLNLEAGQPLKRSAQNPHPKDNTRLERVQNLLNSLPTSAKVVVGAIAALIALSLLQTVFKVVTSLITLAILGIILYLIYQFAIAPKLNRK